MELATIGNYVTPSGDKVSYAAYIKNPKYPEAIIRLSHMWETKLALRAVADLKKKEVYIFPYWVLHSDFLQDELKLDYATLMDGKDYIFASIELHPAGLPYAIVGSSQTDYLLKSFNGDKQKMLDYLEGNLAFLRKYCIEPIAALKY